MNQEIIDKIKHLLNFATPGPWEAQINDMCHGIMVGDKPLFLLNCCIIPDAHLVCELRNHANDLLDEIEQLRARVAELEARDARRKRNEMNQETIIESRKALAEIDGQEDDSWKYHTCGECKHRGSMYGCGRFYLGRTLEFIPDKNNCPAFEEGDPKETE